MPKLEIWSPLLGNVWTDHSEEILTPVHLHLLQFFIAHIEVENPQSRSSHCPRRHPIENKLNFLEVDGEILERVDVIYYGDPSRLR